MKTVVMLGALAVAAAQGAQAADFKAGDWNVSLGGQAVGCGGEKDRTTIGNGLLPNGLVTSATSRQGDYDVKALIGIYNATATDSAIAVNSGVDVRQAYFTFGNDRMGTVKLGRDNGIFGATAIFADMTLIGTGAPVQATQRGRVTLGHIGAGYSYVGYYGQIAYSAPKSSLGGFGLDAALVSPVADTPIVAAPVYTSKTSPQFQAQLSYAADGFKTWLGAKSQKFSATAPGVRDFTMAGVEAGASYQAGALGVLANFQGGRGLGILSDADQGDTRSKAYFVQATYKPADKVKLGLSYGISRNDDDTAGTFGLKSNANLTGGVYWSLTSAITLVGEVGQTRSKAFTGAQARMNGASLGGIIFF